MKSHTKTPKVKLKIPRIEILRRKRSRKPPASSTLEMVAVDAKPKKKTRPLIRLTQDWYWPKRKRKKAHYYTYLKDRLIRAWKITQKGAYLRNFYGYKNHAFLPKEMWVPADQQLRDTEVRIYDPKEIKLDLAKMDKEIRAHIVHEEKPVVRKVKVIRVKAFRPTIKVRITE